MTLEPADIPPFHLELGDLIAVAADQPVGESARRHLDACEQCRREAERWKLVADGVRARATPAPGVSEPTVALRTRRRVRTRWQRALLGAASAAVALVLLVGIGEVAGVVHVHIGNSAEPTLTAVAGCGGLAQADGTLTEVKSSRLVVQTGNGQLVTVTTSASTFITRSGAPLSAITDGSSVMVRGQRTDGSFQAAVVTVGQPFDAVQPPGLVAVQGTVADASAAGFTLVTSSGLRLAVTTSAATLVVVLRAGTDALQAGTAVFAVGYRGADGTLAARAVAAVAHLPFGRHTSVSLKNCSSRSIVEALGVISVAAASAG